MTWLLLATAVGTWALVLVLVRLLLETLSRRPDMERSHDPSHDMDLE